MRLPCLSPTDWLLGRRGTTRKRVRLLCGALPLPLSLSLTLAAFLLFFRGFGPPVVPLFPQHLSRKDGTALAPLDAGAGAGVADGDEHQQTARQLQRDEISNNIKLNTDTETDSNIPTSRPPILGIGILIPARLTKGSRTGKTEAEIKQKFQFFKATLPNLVRSFEVGYNYTIYVGLDEGDGLIEYVDYMKELSRKNRRSEQVMVTVVAHVVSAKDGGNFVKVVNLIAKRSFVDGNMYTLRMNDDSVTRLRSEWANETRGGWTTDAIHKLKGFKPPNIGVVGPTCRQGAVNILTHDFVHRCHFGMFGYHYPPEFKNWFSDDWITEVYRREPYVRVDVSFPEGDGVRTTNKDSKRLLELLARKWPEKAKQALWPPPAQGLNESESETLHLQQSQHFHPLAKEVPFQKKSKAKPGSGAAAPTQQQMLKLLFYHLPSAFYGKAKTEGTVLKETRYAKLPTWEVVHTLAHGTRYKIDYAGSKSVKPTVERGQSILQLFIAKLLPLWEKNPEAYDRWLNGKETFQGF